MDLYRLGFLLTQIIALFFLAIKVYTRNKLLQVKFIARVKRRLVELNEESGMNMDININLTDAEKASIDPNRTSCLWFTCKRSQRSERSETEEESKQVSKSSKEKDSQQHGVYSENEVEIDPQIIKEDGSVDKEQEAETKEAKSDEDDANQISAEDNDPNQKNESNDNSKEQPNSEN